MFHSLLLAPLLALPLAAQNPATPVAEGSAPQLAVDAAGTVRMIYGKRDTIFARTSTDHGATFGAPVQVGVVTRMYLGNTSGPVIASSKTRSLVSAIDRAGDMHLFFLDHAGGSWTRVARPLNDAPRAVPEGLMMLAANGGDTFQAVWLDQRVKDRNEIYTARITTPAAAAAGVPNVRVYASPGGSVCECCRPSVALRGDSVTIMFRNNVEGNRDMYLIASGDRGATFGPARKLGQGSWKFDACPVDGGAMEIGADGRVATVWRREAAIWMAAPGGPEVKVADGRSPMMSLTAKGPALVWIDGAQVMYRAPGAAAAMAIGQGRLPQVLALRDGKVLTAWEQLGKIYLRRMD